MVVGIDEERSPMRWAFAGSLRIGPAVLVLPRNTFPGNLAAVETGLRETWTGPVYDRMPLGTDAPMVVIVSGEEPGVLAGLLARIAARPAMKNKLLAVWSLSGPLRGDVPAWLLERSELAGLGIAETSVVGQREVRTAIGTFQRDLDRDGLRVDQLGGPFLWYF